MDLNNIYGDYLVKRRVTMMLQFVYKGDYTLAVQLYHNHAIIFDLISIFISYAICC